MNAKGEWFTPGIKGCDNRWLIILPPILLNFFFIADKNLGQKELDIVLTNIVLSLPGFPIG